MKVIHEDQDKYVIQHPSGRTMHISKSGMSPEASKLINTLHPTKFAEGDEVQPDPTGEQPLPVKQAAHQYDKQHNSYDAEPNPPPTTDDRGISMTGPVVNRAKGGEMDHFNHQTNDSPNPKLSQVPEKDRMPGQIVQHFHFGGSTQPGNFSGGSSFMDPAAQPPQNYVQPAQAAAPPATQDVQAGAAQAAPVTPDPNALPTTPTAMATSGQQMQESALRGQAGVQGKISDEAAKAYQAESEGLSKGPQLEDELNRLHTAWDTTAGLDPKTGQPQFDQNGKPLMNPNVDPNHYWGSKSTPNKIASAIGLLFSGAALGIGGHADLAMKAIQDAQDRDIDAQKATFNNKDNLLRAYTQQYNSAILGEQATRMHLAAQTEAKIRQATAQNGGAMAQLASQQAIGQLRSQVAPMFPNLAAANAITSSYRDIENHPEQAGTENQWNQMNQIYQMSNPEMYKERVAKTVPGVGTTAVPLAEGERNSLTGYDEVDKALDEAEKFTKGPGAAGSIPFTTWKQRAGDITAQIQTSMNKLTGLNRINPFEAERYKQEVKNIGSLNQPQVKQAIADLRNAVHAHRDATYSAVGLTPFKRGTQAAQQSPQNQSGQTVLKTKSGRPYEIRNGKAYYL